MFEFQNLNLPGGSDSDIATLFLFLPYLLSRVFTPRVTFKLPTIYHMEKWAAVSFCIDIAHRQRRVPYKIRPSH